MTLKIAIATFFPVCWGLCKLVHADTAMENVEGLAWLILTALYVIYVRLSEPASQESEPTTSEDRPN